MTGVIGFAGALVAAAVLREIAAEVAELIVRTAPPDVGGWQRRAGARPCRSVISAGLL
jgi:hypothetical protein